MEETLSMFTPVIGISSQLVCLVAMALVAMALVIGGFRWGGLYSYQELRNMNIPGPPPLPYLGNLWEISKLGGYHFATSAFMKKYGKVYGLCIGRNPTVVINDPEMLKQILVKDFHLFRNRFSFFKRTTVMKSGLLDAQDETWKRIRSTLSPTFTSGKLRLMTSLMEKSGDTLVGKLATIADTGNTVDMVAWFSQMGLEVILSTSFGVSTDIQTNPNHELLANAKAFFRTPPILRILAILPFFYDFMGLFISMTNTLKCFVELSKDIIRARTGAASDHVKRRDLVDMMLLTQGPDGARKLSDDEIVAQSVSFLLAGHETTSNTLSSTVYYLALNPDVQDRLRQEIRSATMKSEPHVAALDLANDLEYLDCVINETLRIHPPGYTSNRMCSQQYTINGLTIPAGMMVTCPIYALHHNPDAWPEPDKFDPERFRGPAKESRHPFQFLPFGAGPRHCIGMRLALMVVKLTLFKVLSKYRFVRCPETQVPLVLVPGLALIARDGIHLRVETA